MCPRFQSLFFARSNDQTHGPTPLRSEGKVLILASVHDTFTPPEASETLWVSCKDYATMQRLKYGVVLANAQDLPASCEYMDRGAFDVIDSAGRGLCWVIDVLGIGPRLSALWDLKLMIESLPLPFAGTICDQALHAANSLFPAALPAALMRAGAEFDHHVLISVVDYGGGEGQRFMDRLSEFCADTKNGDGAVKVHRCSADEVTAVG